MATRTRRARTQRGGTYRVGKSSIHGVGIIAKRDFSPNEKIFKAIEANKKITPIGRKINHCPIESQQMNTILVKEADGWWIVGSRRIKKGEELTLDYNTTPDFIAKANPAWKCS